MASRVPDKPITLANNAAVTTAYQVGLTWSQGAYAGGTAVIDYRVNFKSTGDYSVFSSAITTTSVTVTGLTPGVTYTFYVQARNRVGYSPNSDTVQVLAAQVPDAPTSFADNKSVTNAFRIGLTWVVPVFNGGSVVIDYSIFSDSAQGGAFTELANSITGSSYTVNSVIKGSTYKFRIRARNTYGFSVFSSDVSILAA